MSKLRIAHLVITLICTVFFSTLALAADKKSPTKLSDLPAEAQWGVSAALGSDMREYHVRLTREGYQVENPGQKLNARFGSLGLDVQAESTHFGMSVRGYGYGTALTPVHHVRPSAGSNRVEYRRGALTEWYVNGPLGLEQGFTLSRRPGKANGQPLRIAMDLSGDLSAATEGSGMKLTRNNGVTVLRYAGLTARDANGKELTASLVIEPKKLLLEIDDSAACYPVTIDPTIQNFTLTASNVENGDEFGISVAIDGNTVVVGTSVVGPMQEGAAYVFVKPANGWRNMTQTAALTSSDEQNGDSFGNSVAVSGNSIVVGAARATVNGNNQQGAAYVFVKPTNGWTNMTETAKLTPSDGAPFAYFGTAIAIRGNTVVVGSPSSNSVNAGPGTAYVFVEPVNGWIDMTQTAELAASDGTTFDDFGYAVSVSSSTIIVGGGQCSSGCPGTAYIFQEPANGWVDMTETAELTASNVTGPSAFASSVSISGDTAVVGDPFPDQVSGGAVYVFVEPSGGWINMNQTAELTDGDTGSYACFGNSVSITGDVILAGDECIKAYTGAAYLFLKPAGGWQNSSHFALKLSVPFRYQTDFFGSGVAISGTTGIIGAWRAPTMPPCKQECAPGPGEVFLYTKE